MKKIILAALILTCTFAQAQITQTIVHETGGNTVTYQLSSLDSIVYDSLNVNMIIHETGGNTVTFQIANIDSVTYDTTVIATCGIITDSRDGAVYTTVQIGNQCWMAENLRYNTSGLWLNSANPSTIYGRLYNWATVMNGATTSSSNPSGVQGVCPSGWHLPSDAEWNEMEMALGMPAADTTIMGWRGTDHGTQMKSTSGWNSNGNGTNTSGFNVFPTGHYLSGSFEALGGGTAFWSTTEYSVNTAFKRNLHSSIAGGSRYNDDKIYGFPCRCVKN